jgi:hypothetical protein
MMLTMLMELGAGLMALLTAVMICYLTGKLIQTKILTCNCGGSDCKPTAMGRFLRFILGLVALWLLGLVLWLAWAIGDALVPY